MWGKSTCYGRARHPQVIRDMITFEFDVLICNSCFELKHNLTSYTIAGTNYGQYTPHRRRVALASAV